MNETGEKRPPRRGRRGGRNRRGERLTEGVVRTLNRPSLGEVLGSLLPEFLKKNK